MIDCTDANLSAAANFYYNQLGLKDVLVRIELLDDDFKFYQGVYSEISDSILCFVVPVVVPLKVGNKTYTAYYIGIRGSYAIEEPEDALIGIAHEFVHIQQYCNGSLSYTDEGTIWNGKLYQEKDGISFGEYESQPWEVDAYEKQEYLYDLYVKTRIN